jgi:hypothetical protein
MLKSAAWLDLSGNAVKLLVHIASFEDGRNNGEIFMSTRAAAAGIGVTKKTAGLLLKELVDHGFIQPTEQGYFQVKGGPATQWRLTWQSWPAKSKGPSNEWRAWTHERNRSRGEKLPGAGVITAPRRTPAAATGVETTPAEDQKPQKSVVEGGVESTPQTIATGEGSGPLEKTGQIDPHFLSGPDLAPEALRRRLREIRSDVGAERLADACSVSVPTLAGFIDQRTHLEAAALARVCRGLRRLQVAA